MSKLVLATDCVSYDEPCFSLREFNEQSPDSKGWRRWLIVKVIRHGDQITEFRHNLGPAKRFKADQFIIPGGVRDEVTGKIEIVETVGRLVDIANEIRALAGQPSDYKPIDLIQGYYDARDKRRLRRRRRSMISRLVRVQRD